MSARKQLDDAYLELSQETGSPAHLLREAALEISGHADGTDFQTEREEAGAIARLTTGLRDGTLQASRWTEQRASQEHQRLARLHGEPYSSSPSAVRFDEAKLSAHEDAPPPVTLSREAARPPQPARLTAAQQAEVDRLAPVALSMQRGEAQRPAYGGAAGGPGPYELDLSAPPAGSGVSDSQILASVLGIGKRRDTGYVGLASTDAPAPRYALSPRAHRELGELRDVELHNEAHRIREHATLARTSCQMGDHDGAAHHLNVARRVADQVSDDYDEPLENVQAELSEAARSEAAHGGNASDYGRQAFEHQVGAAQDGNATDPRQPAKGGKAVAAYLDDLAIRHLGLGLRTEAGDPTQGEPPNSTGNSVVRPKSPAERARERRRSRPGHTGGTDG